jgi:hypothetical protein
VSKLVSAPVHKNHHHGYRYFISNFICYGTFNLSYAINKGEHDIMDVTLVDLSFYQYSL